MSRKRKLFEHSRVEKCWKLGLLPHARPMRKFEAGVAVKPSPFVWISFAPILSCLIFELNLRLSAECRCDMSRKFVSQSQVVNLFVSVLYPW
jgi:hypothetical protein